MSSNLHSSKSGKNTDVSAPDPAQDLSQGTDRFVPSLGAEHRGGRPNDAFGGIISPSYSAPTFGGLASAEIPDVLYAVSARVERRDASGYSWMVELPTFYLDSRVQGITGEDHAERIVVNMLAPLGHDKSDIYVQACATLAPISDRTGS